MILFDSLYAAADPGRALREWALEPCRAVAAPPPPRSPQRVAPVFYPAPVDPALRVCAVLGCGKHLHRDNQSGVCSVHRSGHAGVCQAADCTQPLFRGNQSGYCRRHFQDRPTKAARLSNHAQAAAKQALVVAMAVVAEPVAAPVAVAPPATPSLIPGLPPTCAASPTGGHRMLPFGGMALPGQRTHYCAYCQPRGTAHKQDFFGGSVR